MAKRLGPSKGLYLDWEVEWSQRRRVGSNEQVWARNVASTQKRARAWHWTTWYALKRAGVKWVPRIERSGRYLTTSGYVIISRGTLTKKEQEMVGAAGLRIGSREGAVKEHHLVALKKYGALPPRFLIRHLNGNKQDNRPKNLVLGTAKDNSLDHHQAVIKMMLWRERAMKAEGMNITKALTDE